MEIAPVPHRATRSEWRRLALGVLVLMPVVLLVLLPAVLGLDRYVVTDSSMDGSLGRGSIVLARDVPPADLRVGDVIAVRASSRGSDDPVNRRIVAIHDDVATVAADTGSTGPVRVHLTGSSYSRVWFAVPWIGFPFVVEGGWAVLAGAALAVLLVALAAGRRHAPKPVGTPRARVSVG